jgi:hypothetical protein
VLAAAGSALLPGATAAHAYRDLRMSPETRVVAASKWRPRDGMESNPSPNPTPSFVPTALHPTPLYLHSPPPVLGRFIIPLGLCLYFAVNRKRMAREEAVRAGTDSLAG